MLNTVLSLGELAVMYPVNGSYYEYCVRFIDPSWLVTNNLSLPAFILILLYPKRLLMEIN